METFPRRVPSHARPTPSAPRHSSVVTLLNDKPMLADRGDKLRGNIAQQFDNSLWLYSKGRKDATPVLGCCYLALLTLWNGTSLSAFNSPDATLSKCAAALPNSSVILTESEVCSTLVEVANSCRARRHGGAFATALESHVDTLSVSTTRRNLLVRMVEVISSER